MNENMNNGNDKNLPIGGSSASKDTGGEGETIGGGMGSSPIGGASPCGETIRGELEELRNQNEELRLELWSINKVLADAQSNLQRLRDKLNKERAARSESGSGSFFGEF